MNDAYVQGFIDKCAQAGVDPETLVTPAEAINLDEPPITEDQLPELTTKPKPKPKTREELSGAKALKAVWGKGSPGLDFSLWRD